MESIYVSLTAATELNLIIQDLELDVSIKETLFEVFSIQTSIKSFLINTIRN